MGKPIIAVVGRPNVGKSTLFNKIAGKRLSIVDDTPGVTRDRLYADCTWLNHEFSLIDTGGLEPDSTDLILSKIKEQANLALDSADAIIMVTDLTAGVTAVDFQIADMLRRSHKPIVVAVNKCDTIGDNPPEFYEFYNMGLDNLFPVSAVHGHGTGDLLDRIFELIDYDYDASEEENVIKVAVVGKPNVGKSSLINRIIGQERTIVSNVAGTTRDAIDVLYENENGKYLFIDTAGIRRKSRVEENIERYSVLRSYMAVDRADVVLILIDAREGVTEQDTKIAGYADDKGKACIIVANKWDATEKETNTMEEKRKDIMQKLGFMSYAPIVFISALTGQRVEKIFPMITDAHEQNNMRITTGLLNTMLAHAIAKVQPPTDKGKRLKLYYMTQASTCPPTFIIFVNNAELFHFSYKRYIENCIRENFGLAGTPIRLIIRERNEKDSK